MLTYTHPQPPRPLSERRNSLSVYPMSNNANVMTVGASVTKTQTSTVFIPDAEFPVIDPTNVAKQINLLEEAKQLGERNLPPQNQRGRLSGASHCPRGRTRRHEYQGDRRRERKRHSNAPLTETVQGRSALLPKRSFHGIPRNAFRICHHSQGVRKVQKRKSARTHL